MTRFLHYSLLFLALAPLLAGCVDDNYDLSDIDTNTELKVNNLTIPINIDSIRLNEIISLSDGSKIKEYDGGYALLDNGEFTSNDISVNQINAKAPEIAPTYTHIKLETTNSSSREKVKSISFNIEGDSSPFSYAMSDVDPALHSVTSVETNPLVFTISIDASGISSITNGFHFENLTIQFPKGMIATPSAGTYDTKTGIVTIPILNTQNGKAEISLTATEFDFTVNDAGINSDHLFHFNSELSIKSGKLLITDENIDPSKIPAELTLTTNYKLTDLVITAFSGVIDYSVDGLQIDPIDLTDIPDFLNQDGTDLYLNNPQIYLSLSNPLERYNLRYQAGLTITAIRPDMADKSYSINDPFFTIKGNFPETNLILSPSMPDKLYPGYNDASHVGYTSLSNLLGGGKIPTQLKVDVIDPTVPLQKVEKFRLGINLGNVKGKWQLVAPLNLKPNSVIIYSKLEDGWTDETLDAIKITSLEVSAKAFSNLPIGAELSGYPVGKDGNKITGVEIESVQIPANASDHEVLILVKGTVTNLDGFYFKAVVKPGEEKTLSPDEFIRLDNIRIRVSGTYTKKL